MQPRTSARALTGSTLSLQPAKRNHAQQLVCLRVFASVWHSLKSANRSSHRTSSRPCQPQSPDKPSGCPIWHGDTHTQTPIVQADLRGLDWTEGSEHSGFSESMSLPDLHNYSTRLTLACYHGDTNCRLPFKLLPA